jgi:hypothetical protein
MPVIGRLDGQVEEVIIKPISERRRDKEEMPADPQDEETPARPPTVQSHTPHANESSAEPDELPVWLL